MSPMLASALRLSRLLPAAALLATACKDSPTGPGAPARLAFTLQPVTNIVYAGIPTFTVTVQDAAGNTITGASNTINLIIGNNNGQATLSGTTSVVAVNGVATFSDIKISSLGTGYSLVATTANLTAAVSNPFDVTFGPAAKLVFSAQPGLGSPGGTIAPPVTVTVLDQGDYIVTTAANSITVAIGTNPGSATLSGTTTATPVNGVATFSNLSINNAGKGYTLTAAATSLTGATSAIFTIRNPLIFAVISAGYFHTCGVTTVGEAYCWGDNFTGALGDPALSSSVLPAEVSGGLTFAKIVAGRDHTCGVNPSSVAYCWGWNDGRLGTAPTSGTQIRSPALVSGNYIFAAVSAAYAHTCGVTTAGVGYCWGDNTQGELGIGSLTSTTAPTAVLGGLTFASISPGRYFSCGVTTANAAHCWGDNFYGELGDGTKVQRTGPVPVSGGFNFASVSAGGFHACGLTTGGLAYCWGAGGNGQLGDGNPVVSSSIPVAVAGGRTFASISVGNRHTCGVTTSGVAYCWGENSTGHLGIGTRTGSNVPVAVSGGYTFASLTAGRFHTCGLTTAGKAYCWGENLLGDGSTGSLVPVAVR